ncbi:helicase HerA domain-containing protein [Cellulomonas sp. Leaf395]|uniref:helicase HerA domain-containing protein n=1 Tax=Cellulomonas sp. Leaf395 TaxID=1736362 RepID=UPI0006F22B02|nr:DUF87 domain-containing protein [Cellulomonas sp. Leaf395]KQT01271.1 hypothetical protein ASG23_06770 [Cellulomonas sp. Leaf395]
MTPLPELIRSRIADLILSQVAQRPAGHCVRIDELTFEDSRSIATTLRADLSGRAVEVHVLVDSVADAGLEVPAERAIEIRNRKECALVLLVPSGAGHAASSLDNSFEPIPGLHLLSEATDRIENEIEPVLVRNAVAAVRRRLGAGRSADGWARYVATVAATPTLETAGADLWQVGLIPDLHGATFVDRLAENAACVSALARPARPTATISDRLGTRKIQVGGTHRDLVRFFDVEAALLADVPAWAKKISEPPYAGQVSFEQWPLIESQEAELEDVNVDPFVRPDGVLIKATKLRQDRPGDLPFALVMEDDPGDVVVTWKTRPSASESVDRWLVEVVAPDDLRSPDDTAIATARVSGTRRRATVHLDIAEDDVEASALFVVRVTPLDSDGNPLLLRGGEDAAAESQQFEVRFSDATVQEKGRRRMAPSLPLARLQAALDGFNDLTEDVPSWDASSQTYSVRLGAKRNVQVRISRVLLATQRIAQNEPSRAFAFSLTGRRGQPAALEDIARVDITAAVPVAALLERRRKLLEALSQRAPRDAVESLEWDDQLISDAIGYVQSYRRALDATTESAARRALLTMDTVALTATTATGPVAGVVVLPFHPLRLGWLASHAQGFGAWASDIVAEATPKAQRRELLDIDLARRVTPANMPYTAIDADDRPYVYCQEVSFGTGLFIDATEPEPAAAADTLLSVLGADWAGTTWETSAHLLVERLQAYRDAHPGLGALRLLALNPGSGELIAEAVERVTIPNEAEADGPDRHEIPPRVEVTAYSLQPSFTDPLPALRAVQQRIVALQVPGRQSHLTPPLRVIARPTIRIRDDLESHHLAFLSDVSSGSIVTSRTETSRQTAFGNLLTPTNTVRTHDGVRATWWTQPALQSRGKGNAADVVDAHRAHQEATAGLLGGSGTHMAVRTDLEPDDLALIRAVHQRSDWVVTLDRFMGIDLYDDPSGSGLGADRYVLDYAPGLLEGLSHHVTVTTQHRDEVARILADAMANLGLAAVEQSVGDILHHLAIVSGRLALRLLGNTSLAREAVSLAALVAHLRRRGKLENVIIVPVDAHPEIFGVAARTGDASARRCDLLLVRVTNKSLKIECVEVKSRRDAALPDALADRIVEQLDATRDLLVDRFFRTDPPRLDATLQRARLAGVLSYYAQRSALNGLIDAERLTEIERYLDRLEDRAELEDGKVNVEITRQGYVIALDGNEGFPDNHRGVPMAVLTAADLGAAGFTTVHEIETRTLSLRPATDGSDALPLPIDENLAAPATEPARSPTHTPAVMSRAAATKIEPVVATTKAIQPVERGDERPPDPTEPTEKQLAAAPPEANGKPAATEIVVALGQDGSGGAVTWRVSTKGSPHLFILGIPGQGKSVTTRRILRTFSEQELPSLVLDFHGDMAASPPPGSQVLDAALGLPFSPLEPTLDDHARYKQSAWELSEVIGYVCRLGDIQRNLVYEALNDAYQAQGFGSETGPVRLPTIEEFAAAADAREQAGRARNTVARLRPLTDFALFRPEAGWRLDDHLHGGLVVDLHNLGLEEVQLAASAFILRKVYRDMFRWGQADRMRLAIVLDEAHRVAKDVTLPKLMKEGRKYGIGVIVASQGIADFHSDVLGTAGTKVVFRTNFPDSRQVAGLLRARGGQDISQALEQLGVGQAYVSTPDHAQARKVYMDM